MNVDENGMDYVHLMDEKLIGCYPWKGGLDLLGTLLSMELFVDKKLEIMEKEYNILVGDRIREPWLT